MIAYVDGVVANTTRGPEGGRTAQDGRDHSAFGGSVVGTAFLIDGVNMNSSEAGEVETRMDFDNLQEVSFTGVGRSSRARRLQRHGREPGQQVGLQRDPRRRELLLPGYLIQQPELR